MNSTRHPSSRPNGSIRAGKREGYMEFLELTNAGEGFDKSVTANQLRFLFTDFSPHPFQRNPFGKIPLRRRGT